ncbi:MAG: hypothetical protein ABIO80_06155 [Sphingomicrobium sp.]
MPPIFASEEREAHPEWERLAWFEMHATMASAIVREKRVKRWPRAWKYDRIHARNLGWRDLAEDFGFPPLK